MRFSRLAMALTLWLPACTPMIDVHGDALPQDKLDSLTAGETSFEEVRRVLGSPSARSVFDSENWIYVHSKQERMAFFKPEEIERTVTVLKFDRNGIYQGYQTKTLKDGRMISLNPDKTPMDENKLTVMDQMISNVGRLATDAPVH